MWPGRARAAKRAEFRVFELHQTCRWQCFSWWCFSALNASCEWSNTIDQKGVQQAFQRYHASCDACLGRKVSNAVGRPSKPLPACVWTSMSEAFLERFFSTSRLFRKNEEESIAIECHGYPLAKHEDSRTIRLRLDTFPKWKFRQPVRGRWTTVSARVALMSGQFAWNLGCPLHQLATGRLGARRRIVFKANCTQFLWTEGRKTNDPPTVDRQVLQLFGFLFLRPRASKTS